MLEKLFIILTAISTLLFRFFFNLGLLIRVGSWWGHIGHSILLVDLLGGSQQLIGRSSRCLGASECWHSDSILGTISSIHRRGAKVTSYIRRLSAMLWILLLRILSLSIFALIELKGCPSDFLRQLGIFVDS